MLSTHNPPIQPPEPSGPSYPLALVGLGLSIFAFMLPLGVAAVVAGHVAEKRIVCSHGSFNGKFTARAALWIGCLQMGLAGLILLLGWNFFRDVVRVYQLDALVQHVLRTNDGSRPL